MQPLSESIRWGLITLCYTAPKVLRRLIINLLKRYPPWPEEKGDFRTDVAIAAFGMLRGGDVAGFQVLLGNYPFPEFWEGQNRRIEVRHIKGAGWRVFTTWADPRFGKATLPRLPDEYKTGGYLYR